MNSSTAPLPIPPTVSIDDHVKLQRGRTGIVKFIGNTDSYGSQLIGLLLDTYDPNAHDGKGYFTAPKGRGYFTRTENISNIILPDHNQNNQTIVQHKFIVKLKKILRQIKVLECKHKHGVILHPNQLLKIKKKQEYETQLETLQNNTFYIGGLSKRAILDSHLTHSNKQLITVDINDSVQLKTGKTGIVKYVGQVSVMAKEKQLIGILMHQSHSTYCDGTIDNIQYINGPRHRCYFVHPEQITHRFAHDKILLNEQKISMTVNQRYAEIIYSFDFENRCNYSKELKFEITMASDAFISSFVADIDGVLFHGKTKEKQEAKQQYETAKQKQENAILISQPYQDIPNLFQISTNIDSKSEISLQITIEQYITKQFNFNQLNVQILKSFNENIITQYYDKIPFELHLFDSRGMYDISILNVVGITKNDTNELNTYCCMNGIISCGAAIDNELILKYKVKGEQSDSNILYDDETGTFCHIISNLIEEINANVFIPRRVVIIIDRSGSMSGIKWDKTISATITALKQLRCGYDRYCVILCGNELILYPKQQITISDNDNVEKCIKILEKQRAKGCELINDALLKGIQLIKDDIKLLNVSKDIKYNYYQNQVILLTDGEPTIGETNTDKIVENVKNANNLKGIDKYSSKICVHSFGIGSDRNDGSWARDLNHNFLKLLSVNNYGIYQRIKQTRTDILLNEYFDILSKPVLTNIQIKYTNTNCSDLTKTSFNTLFAGNDIIICGKLHNIKTLTLTANVTAITGQQIKQNNGKLIVKPININKTIKVKLNPYETNDDQKSDNKIINGNIERIFAYLKLKQFSEKRLMDDDMIEFDEDDDKIPLALAMKYQFVTPWTSMIIVQEKSDNCDNQCTTAPNQDITISNTIKLKDGSCGIVKYVGNIDFTDEKMVGVELDTWSTNAYDGTVNDKEYFISNPGRGYFARMCGITDWNIPNQLLEQAKILDNEIKKDDDDDNYDMPIDETENSELINVNIGDIIITMRGYEGIVKFIGCVHFHEGEMIGIELNRWIPNGCNGIIHGHKYFKCKDGYGLFILKNGIKCKIVENNENIKLKSVTNMIIGDKVKLKMGKSGIVKYLGNVEFTNYYMVGIVLDEWSANGNDGIVNGKQYFKTNKGTGYFVRKTDIVQVKGIVNMENDNDINVKKEILKIEYLLRKIEILKLKKVNGLSLNSHQITKMEKEKGLRQILVALKKSNKML